MQSNLDKIVVCKSICYEICILSLYLPKIGFAAANTEVLEFNLVVMPAFAMLIVCCSIASWIATLSAGFILSNSSIHTIPPSAKTRAPPSIWNYPVEGSLFILAVKPAAEEPFPLVYTAMEAVCSTNLRNWDLAVEGSPMSKTLISPLRMVLSGRCLRDPPKSIHAMTFLTYSFP